MKVNIKSRFDRDFMKCPSPDSKKILYNQENDMPDAGGRGEVEKLRRGEVEKRGSGESEFQSFISFPLRIVTDLANQVTLFSWS